MPTPERTCGERVSCAPVSWSLPEATPCVYWRTESGALVEPHWGPVPGWRPRHGGRLPTLRRTVLLVKVICATGGGDALMAPIILRVESATCRAPMYPPYRPTSPSQRHRERSVAAFPVPHTREEQEVTKFAHTASEGGAGVRTPPVILSHDSQWCVDRRRQTGHPRQGICSVF